MSGTRIVPKGEGKRDLENLFGVKLVPMDIRHDKGIVFPLAGNGAIVLDVCFVMEAAIVFWRWIGGQPEIPGLELIPGRLPCLVMPSGA